MKEIIFTLLTLISVTTFAQTEIPKNEALNAEVKSLQADISKLKTENGIFKNDLILLDSKLSSIQKKVDSLEGQTNQNSSAILQTADTLGVKISKTEANATQKFTEVDKSLSSNLLLGVIAVLLAIIVSGLLYWLLNKQQKTNKIEVLDQLSKTKESLEEGLIKEFSKQTNLIEDGLKILAEQKTAQAAALHSEPDHSLALKVANEINMLERNLNQMDKSTKGLKQIDRIIERLKDNLMSWDYEMPVLIGKIHHEGMKVVISSIIIDENIEMGVELISKIITPQVNYKGEMIQTAQVEISKGINE